MALDLDVVRNIAHLARLELTPEEEQLYLAQLEHILGYFSRLDEVDTTGVEPATDLCVRGTEFRDDVVTNSPSVEDWLANAPSRRERFFRVPKIIE